MDSRPIGLFDSGVGGLTIWRAVRQLLPHEGLIYVADSAHFPYGARSPEQLCLLTTQIVSHLLNLECKLIVVACNTATVAALAHLRATFPRVPFVGVVPVVKVLAERTRTGTFALLSTPGTAASPYLADLIARFAPGKSVVNVGCDGLADAIERGEVADPTRLGQDLSNPAASGAVALLDRHLAPVRAGDADVLGLGCTHYPFLRAHIEHLLGPRVQVYDSAEPVAQRVHALLHQQDALAPPPGPPFVGARGAAPSPGSAPSQGSAPSGQDVICSAVQNLPPRSPVRRGARRRALGTGLARPDCSPAVVQQPVARMYTTGDPARFRAVAEALLGEPVGEVESLPLRRVWG